MRRDALQPDALDLVNSWLDYHGLSSSISTTHGGGWMTIIGVPPSQANELLGESYKLNQHTSTNQIVLRILGYSLPAALHACANRCAAAVLRAPVHATQMPRKRSWEEAAAMANASATSGGEPVTVLSKRYNFVSLRRFCVGRTGRSTMCPPRRAGMCPGS